ncbi:MAG: hypothetical protein JWN75_1175 [Candidatus Saccharibacteria bacterium]|nr:hypothetical protein [Candidatus Saccharibacteria bacterium]
MTFRAYVDKKFGADALARIGTANEIITDFGKRGFSLTLRQLYYQHVARGLIENTQQSYNRLGALINDGRLAGLISWTAIEDRTRNLAGLEHYSDPSHVLKAAKNAYRADLWADQDWRPEVWVEKEALADVVGQICNRLRVDYFACRGYVSQSEQWRAGQRLASYVGKGQRPIIFHLGDHDPSGIDMTRDNMERLSMFAGTAVTVVRLALNMEQVEQYNPPPNPAKVTDSRFEAYQQKFGDESWELDALSPEVIQDLILTNVQRIRNEAKWDAALDAELSEKQMISDMIEQMGGDDDAS